MKKIFNRVVNVLIATDVVLLGGVGLMAPIFAVFVADRIVGGNLEVVGYAAAVYWITKSIVIIPFGMYLDRNHGEKDDLFFIIIGSMLAAISIFGYIYATLPLHIYLLQALYAVGMGMNIPGYTAIFTRHIDKGKEAFDWSVHSSLIGLSTGIAGALGGVLAQKCGFESLFIAVGIIVFVSALLPLLCLKQISPLNIKTIKVPPVKGDQPIAHK